MTSVPQSMGGAPGHRWMPGQRWTLACLMALLAGLAQATTYRWVDDRGKVHYGDAIPPQQAGLGHQELDRYGRVVREVPRTRLTPEERRRQAQAAAQSEQARRLEAEQRRRDRALLSSYTSPAEIDLVRDRALDLEALNLKGLKIRLDAALEKLASANGQIKASQSRSQPPAKSLLQMRDEAELERAYIQAQIRQREKAVADLKARYAADKARFMELRGE